MIKQLRRKVIAVTMVSLFLVIGIIISSINLINFQNVKETADMRLDLITENGGDFPKGDDKDKPFKHFEKNGLSPEAPFDTRYFTVKISDEGEILDVNTGKIVAVSADTAEEYTLTLFEKSKHNGFIENYRFKSVETENGYLYAFVDCDRELSTFYTFLFASLGISFFGIMAVFVLVFFLSKIVLKSANLSVEKQKRFITDASHEIKTPLTIIDANTEIIEMEHGESEWTKSTRRQISRLSELTNKLVMLSKLDENEDFLQKENFSLSELVRETAEEFHAIALSKGKTLTFEIQDNINIYADEKSIRQLVSQLCDNAVKYSDEGGKIKISLAKSGKGKVFTIYNTSDEIEKGNCDILFERFYRTDASRNSQKGGHGIGLSVAKAIVTAHKGKISAESTDGRSLTVTVVI